MLKISLNLGSAGEIAIIQTAFLGKGAKSEIKGWSQYHNHAVSSKVFSKLDHIVFNMLLTWAKRRHSNKGVWWTIRRYWHIVGTRKYVFSTENQKLEMFSDVKIVRHRLAKLDKNPFIDKDYFEKWKVRKYYRKKNITY